MSNKCDLTGVGVMSGNNVSKSKRRTRRQFLPNLKEVVLKSDVLGVNVKLKIAANTLRTVNKYGSLDSFIINYKGNKLTDQAKKLRKRIEKAKSLLETTTLKTGEIATIVGYHDMNYFSLAFKKHTGQSPTKYRNSVQK